MRPMSPTAIATYGVCPRRYYYRHVIRAPGRTSADAMVGIALHAALEALHRPGGDASSASVALSAQWNPDLFGDSAAASAARSEADARLSDYLFAWREARPVLLEALLKAEWDGVSMTGVVDRVDVEEDGSLTLIDYKSGHEAITPEILRQLAIYRALVGDRLGRVPDRVAIHHLPTNRRVAVERAPSEWDAILQEALAQARAIAADEDFVPRVGAWCDRCDYASRCVAFKRSQ